MPIPSDLNDEVTFISGINAEGSAGQQTFWRWKGDTPATYATTSARKWGTETAGSTGGEVYYYFDPASSWNTTEQASFVAGLALWSAVANITFVSTTVASQAQITFTRGSDNGGWDVSSVSSTANPSIDQITSSLLSIDTSNPLFYIDGSLVTHGGYATKTILHELGHALGLGHAGPYNGAASTDQLYGSYDSTAWSVMSYNPSDPTGATWGFCPPDAKTKWSYSTVPTTWMPADILAIQRLYGLPATTPLSGGQVFGFNCNIVGPIEAFFDFTKNLDPVVTIWDMGTNNTLDLSGYATGSAVNLNSGTTSSCAGITNNIYIATGTIIDTAIGGSGDDTIIANGDADVLYGNAGNDTFDMQGTLTAADRIDGGSGFDTIVINADYSSPYTFDAPIWTNVEELKLTAGHNYNLATADATIAAGQALTIDGSALGAGDSLVFNGAAETDGTFTLMGGAGNDILTGGAGDDTVSYANAAGGVTVSLAVATVQSVGGGDGSDTLTSVENLTGSAFDDVLTGNSASNVLEGGAGNNTLDGGAGTDTASYGNATGGVNVSLAISGAQTVGGGIGADTLIAIENLTGSAYSDILIGNAGNNVLDGGAGDDTLVGATGNDSLIGGSGTDTADYSADAAGIAANLQTGIVTGNALVGTDTLVSIENLIGGAGYDTLTGNAGDNLLEGGAGDDSLNGGLGSDTASYSNATAGVSVDLSTAAAQAIGGGQGSDTLTSIENLIGSSYDDTLIGDAGDNTLEGGSGNDTLNGGAGSDTASYAHATSRVVVDLNNFYSQPVQGGQGSDTLISIENLIGSAFNDFLTGTGTTKSMDGGASDDIIWMHGALAADCHIDGGSGDNLLVLEGDYSKGLTFLPSTVVNIQNFRLMDGTNYNFTTNDATVAAGARLGISFSSLSSMNTLIFDGSAETDGRFFIICGGGGSTVTTGAMDDRLTGNTGNDVLNGGGGDDSFDGGGGIDALDGGAGLDAVDYSRATSGVTVNLGITTAQTIGGGQGMQTLISIENALGSYYADTLIAGTAGNALVGDAGDDTLIGGTGDDIFNGGAGTDTVDLSAATGGLTVDLTQTTPQRIGGGQGTDGFVLIENLIGSNFGDMLTGDEANNVFMGGAGDDFLDGGYGRDTASYDDATSGVTVSLEVTTAQMVGGGMGTDTLVNFENLIGSTFSDTLVGDGNANALYGGDEHDTLTGGAGNDTLDGGANIDTAIFSGNAAAYAITQGSTGVFTISGSDGTDTLTNIEYAKFDDTTLRLLPGTGTTIDWSADPSTYMAGIRDFDGNDLGSAAGWKLIGTADVNGDGTVEHILVNRQNGRWAEVSTETDGKNYLSNFGWAGDTRVVGIYIDPLVTQGIVVKGGDEDSQRRFQNDLNIENIHGILGQNDYNHDGLQEIYFSLTDGTAYLHAYMHADGNIQYANYQNEQQVKDYLTSCGFTSTTWAGWFPAAQAPLAAIAGG